MKLENKVKKMLLIIVIILMGVMMFGCNDEKPKDDPIIPEEKEILKDFEVITTSPIVEDKVEFALYEVKTGYIEDNYNPYDYTKINVYAEITSPTNKTTKIYGFWYHDYDITINKNYSGTINGVSGTPSKDPNEIQGLEQVRWKSNDYHFRFRFTPTEIGLHKVVVKVEENQEIVQTLNNQINILENNLSNYHGIIKIDESTNRHFIDKDNNTFITNGLNLCWWTNSNRKTYDYDVWFENLANNNGNFARIWMATWGFCQHWDSMDDYNSSQNMAARLDRVMETADKYNIYIQLCLLNHGQFSTTVNSVWGENPYNQKNGGMLSSPGQFFRDEDAKRIYKMELRYLIARYGYSDKLLAWELFNEVDWTDGAESYNMVNIRNWHKEMATFVRENDPYNHLITTSYKYMLSTWNLAFNIDEIDFTSVHSYDFTNYNVNTKLPTELLAVINKYDKPVQIGEIGIDWESGQNAKKVDPNGISIRQALWAGMMSGSVGGGNQWWWDSWIHPNNLWTLYKGAGSFSQKLNLKGNDYELLTNNNFTLNNSSTNLLGYKFNNRIYGYVFNKSWTYFGKTPTSVSNLEINVGLTNGSYELAFYNTVTGDEISHQNVTVTDNKVIIKVPTFNEDIAFIIE